RSHFSISSTPFLFFSILFYLVQLISLIPLVLAAYFDVIGPLEPILAVAGTDTELPCHLSPNISAEHMELRWFRQKLSPAVFLYQDQQEQEAEQMMEYRGRVTMVKDNITTGYAAVRIHGVRASDDGEYRCFFRENGTYEEAIMHLQVAALGSDPHITMEVQENGQIRLECTSVGWYPEPQVQWRTPTGEKLPFSSESKNPDEEGLFTVTTSVVIRHNSINNVSCCIQNLLLDQEKEVGISIPVNFFPRLTPWIVAVAVILIVLGLLTIGSIFFIWRLYKERSREQKTLGKWLTSKSCDSPWPLATLILTETDQWSWEV
uniref:Ig-like domain-containing protein n=1 Tax=Castor canadensis TaxID=51338 RepID=A0A8C0X1M6_CASCN